MKKLFTKRNIKIRSIIVFLLIVNSTSCFCQDLYGKLSKKLCKCIEKEKLKSSDNFQPCIEKVMLDNLKELLEFHGAETMSDFDGSEVGLRLAGKLAKNCLYLSSMYESPLDAVTPAFEPDSLLNCEDIKIGEYYYLNENEEGKLTDTVFTTFTNDGYLERMNNGKTYSRLKLKWHSNCSFDLIFIESNDPFKSSLSEPGDIYKYEVIKNNSSSMVVKYFWNKVPYYLEYFKI